MLQMRGIRPVTDRPLSPLFDSKEAEGAITFPRRRFAFSLLRANSTWRLAGAIADEKHFLQPWHGFLGSSDNNSISNRCTIFKNISMNCFKASKAATFRRSRHHRAHRRPGYERRAVQNLGGHSTFAFPRVSWAIDIHVVIVLRFLRGNGRLSLSSW